MWQTAPSIPSRMLDFSMQRRHLLTVFLTSLPMPGHHTVFGSGLGLCQRCIEKSSIRKMTLLPTDFPERPWQRVAMDLFYHDKWWLIVLSPDIRR